jgi:hypothetical protein
MGFCLLLTALSYALVLMEKNSDIGIAVGNLEGLLAGKHGLIYSISSLSSTDRNTLNDDISQMCNDVQNIATIINANPPNDCRRFLRDHPPEASHP